MKYALLAFLSICAGTAGAQQWRAALPVDSSSGKVLYKGTVDTPGATAEQLFKRAKSYAHVATQAPMIEEATNVVSGPAEKPLKGRILRYEVYIKVRPGGYSYELSDFQNKTMAVQYANGVGGLSSAPGGQAPIERVLNNPDGYRKGKPTAALLSYQQQVAEAAQQAVADLNRAMGAR